MTAFAYQTKRNKPAEFQQVYICFAEREGFEPPVPLGTAVFKTAVIDHSTISPSVSSAKVILFS